MTPGYDRLGRTFILGCLAVALWFGWKVFSPFMTAIATAAILDVVFYPVFERIARRFGGRRGAAAAVTVLIVVLCLILPLLAMGVLVAQEAVQLYTYVSAKAQDGSLDNLLKFRDLENVENWARVHAPWLDVQSLNLKSSLIQILQKVSARAGAFVAAAATNVLGAIGTFAVVLFSLFFFLIGGSAFGRWLGALVPLNREHQERLTQTFFGITKTAVTGSGLVALAQGILGGAAFWVLGLQGVLWGFIMSFTSLIPLVGTALIWFPASMILLVQGRYGAGIFLLLWGVLVISAVDNLIRMFLVKGPVEMPPLLIFFSVLGGIKMAGLLGVVIGPMITAVILTLLEIYRGEFMVRQETGAKEEEG